MTETLILAIESSCDDTAVAIVKNGHQILSNCLSSQTKAHQKHGGVVPELASRLHTEKINYLIKKALLESQVTLTELTHCAVTHGPGLEGALIIGITAANAISQTLNIPLIAINHLHGHIYSTMPEKPINQPFISLIVSGGHSMIAKVEKSFQYEILGQTRDDAAGEAFDKVARMLNLGYPGGPSIENAALSGNPKAFHFPRAMKNQGLDLSFSGLKTSVSQTLKTLPQPYPTQDLCASFQQAVIDILIQKSISACKDEKISKLSLSGGVSANKSLTSQLLTQCNQNNIELFLPGPNLNTDNAAMIGIAAHYKIINENLPNTEIEAKPNLKISD